ncbi:MAG TPA: TFIIB-type zinc ribbon-containing protein [Nitrososphaeraceae archaeon]|jgi:transcription initiation factor TFIIB
MTSTEYYTQCPECASGLIHDYSKGEYICQKCGCVVMDQIDDYGPESNSTDFEEKTRNTRASGFTSFSLHDYGLRTEIGFGSRDYSGKSIDYEMAEQINNMRKWHSRIRVASPKERRLSNVLSKINETCSAMTLPKTLVETAAMLYRNFENKSEAKGKSITCMAAATIYLACKRCSVVRSLDEIVKATGIAEHDKSSVKLASKYYRMMVMEMGVFTEQTVTAASNATTSPSHLSLPPTSPYQLTSSSSSSYPLHSTPIPVMLAIDQYIAKLANMAKIDTKVERLAIDLAHKTDDHFLADGKAPNGLAAAYIYIAAVLLGVNLLQMDVSSLAGVTEVTIRNRCKDILTSFKLTISVKPLAGLG